MVKSALTSKEYDKKIHERFNKINIRTNFNFMKNHNGPRFGSLHLLIGTAGSGKSAVLTGLVENIARLNMDSIFIWLSEEKFDDFLFKLNKFDMPDDDKSKILVESDVDINSNKFNSWKEHIDYIFNQIKLTGCKSLFFDNITTYSKYAGASPSEQTDIALYIKSKSIEFNIATFIVAHTKKDIPDNADYELNESHIRGSSNITNITEYLYIYQRFSTEHGYVPIIRVLKHRIAPMLDKIYLLQFSNRIASYTHDKAINYETYKNFYQSKQTLKGLKNKNG